MLSSGSGSLKNQCLAKGGNMKVSNYFKGRHIDKGYLKNFEILKGGESNKGQFQF